MSAEKPRGGAIASGKPDAGSILEKRQRLSRSILWKLQRRFFLSQGIDAWRKGFVPHYITSNPFVARAYSRVASGFFRDCLGCDLTVDPSQPIYIIELGAGSGRFAYHFLKTWAASAERFHQEGLRFCYVMTDFAPRTLEYWQAHPFLQPFVRKGRLAFARFDAGRNRVIELSPHKETLAPGTVRNPLVVIANYFFDSIPQDLFSIRSGELHERLISVFANEERVDMDQPDLLERIKVAYDCRTAGDNYYGDPTLDELLRGYRHRLENASLLFPCAAIRCLRDLSGLSGGRMLLMAADQGYSSEAEFPTVQDPVIQLHGSISMMVNYHALGEYVLHRGGQVLHPRHHPASLNVSCFLLGYPSGTMPETRAAYEDAIERFGPDDFFILKKGIENIYGSLGLPQMLAYLRLSGGDANIFAGALPDLIRMVKSATVEEREELRQIAHQVWDSYYPIGEGLDVPFQIGVLLYTAGFYRDALEFFCHSQRLFGPHSCTSYDMGMCHYMLGDRATAQACVDEARRLDPACDEAPWSVPAGQTSNDA